MNKKLLAALAVTCLAPDLRAWETVTLPCPAPPLTAAIESQEAWSALWAVQPAPEFDPAREMITVAAVGGDCTFTKALKTARSFMMLPNAGLAKARDRIALIQGADFDGAVPGSGRPVDLRLGGGEKKKESLYRVKDYILPASTMFASGFLDGTIEAIHYHYDDGFKNIFPKADDGFWDPSVSWRNKYKEGDPKQGPKFAGSTNMLVFTTDAYHALRAGKRAIDMFTVVHYINDASRSKMTRKQRFKKTLVDTLILTAVRGVGFTASYALLFKPPN